MDTIEMTVRTLSENPYLGPCAEELGERLRFFPVGSYVIYYRPADDGIRVVRLLHGARDRASEKYDE